MLMLVASNVAQVFPGQGIICRGVTSAGTLTRFSWSYVRWDTILVDLRPLGHYSRGDTYVGTLFVAELRSLGHKVPIKSRMMWTLRLAHCTISVKLHYGLN